MKILKILRQSVTALFRNKGRSFLTILGIIIGIGSVITLISLGNGVQKSISGQISSLGTTTLTVLPGEGFLNRPGSSTRPGAAGGQRFGLSAQSSLTFDDVTTLSDKTQNPHVDKVSGDISASPIFASGEIEKRYNVVGVDKDYFAIQQLEIDKGTLFSENDNINKEKKVLLGKTFANEVFGTTDPIGKTLQIEKDTYTVIGLLKMKDENGFVDHNSEIFAPNRSISQTFSLNTLSNIVMKVDSEKNVDLAKSDIEKTLLKSHKIDNKKLADFNVISPKDLLSTINQVTGLLTTFLAGIGAISLLVGGIGIMNIMLVSVTERTREIGLRKAVGAKTWDILLQFIFESVLLTVTGGIIGILLGIAAGKALAPLLNFQPIVTLGAVLLAVGVSSAVGLIFGIYPAAKAASLNPIDALRYE